MVTIKNTDFTSNLPLASILSVMTKVQMLNICKKLELYVSPNPFGLELSVLHYILQRSHDSDGTAEPIFDDLKRVIDKRP